MGLPGSHRSWPHVPTDTRRRSHYPQLREASPTRAPLKKTPPCEIHRPRFHASQKLCFELMPSTLFPLLPGTQTSKANQWMAFAGEGVVPKPADKGEAHEDGGGGGQPLRRPRRRRRLPRARLLDHPLPALTHYAMPYHTGVVCCPPVLVVLRGALGDPPCMTRALMCRPSSKQRSLWRPPMSLCVPVIFGQCPIQLPFCPYAVYTGVAARIGDRVLSLPCGEHVWDTQGSNGPAQTRPSTGASLQIPHPRQMGRRGQKGGNG